MLKPEGVTRGRVSCVTSKVLALLGLAALGFLLTRPWGPLRGGWIVIALVVIQESLAYSSGSESRTTKSVSVRSTDCVRSQAPSNDRYRCPHLPIGYTAFPQAMSRHATTGGTGY